MGPFKVPEILEAQVNIERVNEEIPSVNLLTLKSGLWWPEILVWPVARGSGVFMAQSRHNSAMSQARPTRRVLDYLFRYCMVPQVGCMQKCPFWLPCHGICSEFIIRVRCPLHYSPAGVSRDHLPHSPFFIAVSFIAFIPVFLL